MIIPCPDHPQSYRDRPMTWMLVALNIVLFLIFFIDTPASAPLTLLKDQNLETAGRAFLQMLPNQPPDVQERTPDWVFETATSSRDDLILIGYYAIRQRFFVEDFSSANLHGDQVALNALEEALQQFRSRAGDDRLHRFGLSSGSDRSLAWLTYQFSHIGLMHLASNLVFLILIGWAIEGIFGGATLLILYVMGGISGGLLFLHLFPGGAIPMVGASGSVSALIGFYSLAETRWRIRYYYLLFPAPGLNGFIYMPAALLIPLFLLADLAGLLASPEGLMTGVAYSAHLGGALFGMGAAILNRWMSVPMKAR